MKSEYFNKRSKNTRLGEDRDKLKYINWEHVIYFVLLVSVWSSCDLLSANQTETNVGVYMWSGTFESSDNQSLLSFLEGEDLNSVFLSVGFDNPKLEKAKQFVHLANERDIDVYLLFGGNEIVRGVEDDQMSKLNQISEMAMQIGVDKIHLNVEPHTFEDWNINRSTYENNYLDMLNNAENIFTEALISLSVSIPHFYDSINPEIEKYVDEAVVMVYETTDINKIKSRTEEESSIFEEKLSIAVRPEDYSNFETLDGVILQIMVSGTARKVYLHDAGALLNNEREIR